MLAFKLLCLQIVFLTIDLSTADRIEDIWNRLTDGARSHNIRVHRLSTTTTTTTTAKPIPTPRTLPPGYIHFWDVQTAYKLHTNKVNWNSARQTCMSEGADLAVIDTRPKLNHVLGMRPWMSWVWTGIYRQPYSGSGSWAAVNGGQLSSHSLPWSLLNLGLLGNCVAVSGLVNGLGSWSCNLSKMYVCEIPEREY